VVCEYSDVSVVTLRIGAFARLQRDNKVSDVRDSTRASYVIDLDMQRPAEIGREGLQTSIRFRGLRLRMRAGDDISCSMRSMAYTTYEAQTVQAT
jgi:hypothetical protein